MSGGKYAQNTQGTTQDGVLHALSDLVGELSAVRTSQQDPALMRELDLSEEGASVEIPVVNGQGVLGVGVYGLTDSGAAIRAEVFDGEGYAPMNMAVKGSGGAFTMVLRQDAQFRGSVAAVRAVRFFVTEAGTGTARLSVTLSTNSNLVQLIAPLPPGNNVIGRVILDGMEAGGEAPNGMVTVVNFPSEQAVTGTFWPENQKVHGAVTVSNLPEVQPVSGSVSVSNLPDSQAITGTVSIDNLPATQEVAGQVEVSNLPDLQAISGAVSVENFPATQQIAGTVSVANLPATQQVSGAVTAKIDGVVPVSGSVSIANLPATQPVSGSVTVSNLPDTQKVSGSVSVSNLPATQAVSGTVSVAGPVPVTGTFWQPIQPVTGTVAISGTVAVSGNVNVPGAANFEPTRVAVTTTTAALVAARAGRRSVTIIPTSNFLFYIGPTAAKATATTGLPVQGMQGSVITLEYAGALFVTGANNGALAVAELF